MAEQFRIGEFWLSKHPTSPNWQITWYDAGRRQTKRVSSGTADFEQAKKALAEHVVLNARPRDQQPTDVRVGEVVARYWEKHAQYLSSAKTIKSDLRYIIERFGEDAVSDLTVARQEDWAGEMERAGLSAGHIRKRLSTLRAAVMWSWNREELVAHPRWMKPPTNNVRREVSLSVAQIAAFLDLCFETHLVRFTIQALATAGRPDAVLQIAPEQIDAALWLVDLKKPGRKATKKRRAVVPIPIAARPWFIPPAGHPPTTPLILYQGAPVVHVYQTFSKRAAAGVLPAGTVPYSLRHTAASWCRMAGVPKWQVQTLLGHREDTTDGYAHYDPGYLRDCAGAINAQLIELFDLVPWAASPASCEARLSEKRDARISKARSMRYTK